MFVWFFGFTIPVVFLWGGVSIIQIAREFGPVYVEIVKRLGKFVCFGTLKTLKKSKKDETMYLSYNPKKCYGEYRTHRTVDLSLYD